jgi:hypothetical protein
MAVVTVNGVRRGQERELRRYISAVCTDGVPPPDFHGEHLDKVFQGAIGPELLEGCHVVRRQYEAILADQRQFQGERWESEDVPAAWRLR